MEIGHGIQTLGRRVLYALTLCILTAPACRGQRTMDGQDNISASVHYTFSGRIPIGGDLWWGRYLYGGNVTAGISLSPFSHTLSTTQQSGSRTIQNFTVLAHGEYLYRIVSDRGRHICLYAGGGVFLGCEIYDPAGRLPGYIVTGLGDCGFLYGITGSVDMEVFVTRRFAIVLKGRLPVNFSSPLSKVRYNAGIAARFNI